METFYHGLSPFYKENSRILILGSFPSVKSREAEFYYAHPRNRFWKTLAGCLGDSVPASLEEKKDFLTRHQIALWDVCESCEVIGSADSSIREVQPVNIRALLEEAPGIELIACTGSTAWGLYMEYLYPITQKEAIKLPSTSPANASLKDDVLLARWQKLLAPYLYKEESYES